MGETTNYSPVIESVLNTYKKRVTKTFFHKAEPKYPEYVVFVTDGDNSDKRLTDKSIIKASKYPIFWQFIGVGREQFTYLEKLDNMSGRFVNNADFFKIDDLSTVTWDKIFNEFPDWLDTSEVQEMLA